MMVAAGAQRRMRPTRATAVSMWWRSKLGACQLRKRGER